MVAGGLSRVGDYDCGDGGQFAGGRPARFSGSEIKAAVGLVTMSHFNLESLRSDIQRGSRKLRITTHAQMEAFKDGLLLVDLRYVFENGKSHDEMFSLCRRNATKRSGHAGFPTVRRCCYHHRDSSSFHLPIMRQRGVGLGRGATSRRVNFAPFPVGRIAHSVQTDCYNYFPGSLCRCRVTRNRSTL